MKLEIHYTATEDKPEVSFNAITGIMELKGRSLPENANTFYDPLEEWLTEYAKQAAAFTEFNFQLDYFNSASHSKLVKLLICLESVDNKEERVRVNWYYHPDDDLMKIRGEELETIIELPFLFLAYSDENE